MKRHGFIAVVLVVISIVVTGNCFAQDSTRVQKTFNIHYHLDDTNYDPNYMGNDHAMSCFASLVDSLGQDLHAVVIHSTSSPEGSYDHNVYLTKNRSADIANQVMSRVPEVSSKIKRVTTAESWGELKSLVEEDQILDSTDKQRILNILEDERLSVVERKEKMRRLKTYPYLMETYYPRIRNSYISVEYMKYTEPNVIRDTVMVRDTVFLHVVDTVYVPMDCPNEMRRVKSAKAKETVVEVKTNLIYDAVTMLNAEVEVPICGRWSVMVEDVFPWWEFSKNQYALQNWEMGIEPRYWLKPWGYDTNKLLGHFFGIYGMSGRGDLQLESKPNYQVHYWSTGITYGYVLPLGVRHWGNLEFSISAGYLSSDYQHYQPTEDHSKLIRDPYDKGVVNWWGPTKVKVSLVIPINIMTEQAYRYQNN